MRRHAGHPIEAGVVGGCEWGGGVGGGVVGVAGGV